MIAIALVMTPAAYHRQTGTSRVTQSFIKLATRLLLWGMWPLMVGLCIDFFLIAKLILDGSLAAALTIVLGSLFISLWFIFPRLNKT